jgi:predicted GH43/DUF377 family glycosyl hydrolase
VDLPCIPLDLKDKQQLLRADTEVRPYDRQAGLRADRAVAAVKFLATSLLVLSLTSCSTSWQPKQARFEISGCDPFAAAFDPAQATWDVQPKPVLERGPEGAWDDSDVLNPSVVRLNGTLYNFYSGFDGKTWHTGLATSEDGSVWEKFAANPILSPDAATWEGDYIAANGTAFHDGEQFLYWYHGGPRGAAQIGLAESTDGHAWRKHGDPVLDTGPQGGWDEAAVADPYVIRCGNVYYMYFLGQNRFGLQRLGAARSEDGVHWQKSHKNPVLDVGPAGSFDENGLGEPAVFSGGQSYYMLYTGRGRDESRRIGWAQSSNGVDWEKRPSAALLEGSEPWNSQVVCDPSVVFDGTKLLVWFGGGNRPSPDENLAGEIGLAALAIGVSSAAPVTAQPDGANSR